MTLHCRQYSPFHSFHLFAHFDFHKSVKKLHFPKYFVFQTNFKPSINSNLIFQHIYNEINLHVTLSHTHNLYSASPILTASSNFCDLNQFFMHFHIWNLLYHFNLYCKYKLLTSYMTTHTIALQFQLFIFSHLPAVSRSLVRSSSVRTKKRPRKTKNLLRPKLSHCQVPPRSFSRTKAGGPYTSIIFYCCRCCCCCCCCVCCCYFFFYFIFFYYYFFFCQDTN